MSITACAQAAAGDVCPRREARRICTVEALRGLAAFYVFLHHFGRELLDAAHPGVGRFFVFGQAAVMLFFILSGFAIHLACFATSRPPSLRAYLVRRFRRIYPMLLVALGASYLATSLWAGHWVAADWRNLAGNLLLLQDGNRPGAWFQPYLCNTPLWSLGYEWCFYLLFYPIGVGLAGRPGAQRAVVFGIAAIGFLVEVIAPNPIAMFFIYFPLWWSGTELGREYLQRGTFSFAAQAAPIALVGAAVLGWAALVLAHARTGPVSLWAHPGIELRQYATGLLILVGGIAWARVGLAGSRFVRMGSALAPLSYALYVIHRPVLQLAARFHATPSVLLDFVLWVLPATLALSYLLERKLQPVVNRALPG